MRFIFGVIVGSVIGPQLYEIAATKYGHILFPLIRSTGERIQSWKPPKEDV